MNDPSAIQKQIEEIHAEIGDVLQRMGASGLTVPMVLQKHARMLDLTAQLAEVSSRRLERQTQQLIYLTWALLVFTAALLFLTFILVKHG